MKIKSAKRITPEPSICIEVDSKKRLFAAGGKTGEAFVSHNSVAQRNIVFGCILRPDSWRFLGIDLKRVELSVYRSYSNVVLGIATTLEDALTVMRFAQSTMMKRYGELEQLGLNNFLDLPNKGQALMVMVDEAGELLGSSGVKALSEDTYIPNLNGKRNLAELEIGDIVFNSYGVPTKVLDIYEPLQQEIFELRLKGLQSVSSGALKEEVIVTGADHYWVVQCPDNDHTEEHTLTTRQLFEELEQTDASKTWKIKRVTTGLATGEQDLLIAPEKLGRFLAGENSLTPAEKEYYFDLTNNEYSIPDIYLYSSPKQRKELLEGLMPNGVFKTKDLYLVQDIQRLLAASGATAVLSEDLSSAITLTRNDDVSDWFEIESIKPIELNYEDFELDASDDLTAYKSSLKLKERNEDTPRMLCVRVESEDSQFLCSEHFIPTHNTDEGKEQDMLKGEASMIIGSIARLGRAAGVHLIIATQRPDATLIPGETKANLGVRLNCGRSDANASSMILGNGEGTRVKANPRGRLYLSIYGRGDHGQGFFADPTWIDEYLAKQGLNPDGTPLSQKQSRLATVRDMNEFADGDLDQREGVDNSSVIDRIRQDEASGIYESSSADDEDWGFGEAEDVLENAAPKERTDSWGGLELGKNTEDKNHRPEDDWDAIDMDAIMDANEE